MQYICKLIRYDIKNCKIFNRNMHCKAFETIALTFCKYEVTRFSKGVRSLSPKGITHVTKLQRTFIRTDDVSSLNIFDIIMLVNMALEDEYSKLADMNEDNQLDILDLVILASTILSQP